MGFMVVTSEYCPPAKSDLDCIGPTTTTHKYITILSSIDACRVAILSEVLVGRFPSRKRSQDSSCQNTQITVGVKTSSVDTPSVLSLMTPNLAMLLPTRRRPLDRDMI